MHKGASERRSCDIAIYFTSTNKYHVNITKISKIWVKGLLYDNFNILSMTKFTFGYEILHQAQLC